MTTRDSAAPPQVRYARSGDIDVAYQVIGDGPIDLVFVMGYMTHLQVLWELPAYRRYLERLGAFTRVIVFDKRGMGMSDRVPGTATLEERMDDIRAVMDAIGSERAVLMGESEGGPLSILFAAAHPERTRALILQGAEVRERTDEDWPWGESTEEHFEAYIAALPERWGHLGESTVRRLNPSAQIDQWTVEWFNRVLVNAATPSAAIAFQRMAFGIDVREVARMVRVPTLIIHSTDDQVCHVENARWLAANIPGSTYIELPGGDHIAYFAPDRVLAEIREFLTGQREAGIPDTSLVTLLFVDLVGSTQRAAELGDRVWADLLERYYATVRREVARFNGREINTAGDGFFLSFDGPARAIRCAKAISEAVGGLGLAVRCGIHIGEIGFVASEPVGLAVHVGARIGALANSGEILVSSTVRDLVAGSGITFADRGSHSLKGVPDQWHVFAVA